MMSEENYTKPFFQLNKINLVTCTTFKKYYDQFLN